MALTPPPSSPPPIVQEAASAVQDTGEAMTDAAEEIVEEVTKTGEETRENAEETAEEAQETASDVSNELTQIAQAAAMLIGDAGRTLFEKIADPVQEIGSGVQQVLKLTKQVFDENKPTLPLSFLLSFVTVVTAVVIVVVAVVVVVFTFGAGGAVVAASVIRTLEVLIGKVNQNSSKTKGEDKGVQSSIGATLILVKSILQRMKSTPNKKRARKIALMELSHALRNQGKTTIALKRASGFCKVDVRFAFRNLQRMHKVLGVLIALIQRRKFGSNRNKQAAINALSLIRRSLAETTNVLQKGVVLLIQKNQLASDNQKSGLSGIGGAGINQGGGQNLNFPNTGGSNSFKVN